MQPDQTIFAPIIEMRSPSELKPDPRNSKLHPPKQLKQVMRSIEEFGWTNPILIDEEGSVLAGHLRLQAAKVLGINPSSWRSSTRRYSSSIPSSTCR
jgi:hypothetical protein